MLSILYVSTLIVTLCLTGVFAWRFRRQEAQWAADVKRLAAIKYALLGSRSQASADSRGEP